MGPVMKGPSYLTLERFASVYNMRRRFFLNSGLTLAATFFFPWPAMAERSAVLLRALNTHRQHIGIPPLFPEPALTQMSQQQALHMHSISCATHAGPGGCDPIERGTQSGYEGRIRGETLAESFEGPLDTLALWIGHDQTCAVLLDTEARDIGLSCIGNPRCGPVYWDLILGA